MNYACTIKRQAEIVDLLPKTGDGISAAAVAFAVGICNEGARRHLRKLEGQNRAHATRRGPGSMILWLCGPKAGAFVAEPDAIEVAPHADKPKQSVRKTYPAMAVSDGMRALPVAFFRAGGVA